ncbi:hypothetical protein AZE42_01243 [Rhizopogon vesiculosus]|nr:hypothetical protein AZE42_01243 [Rhizopogon vesiculosus]
MSTLHA